MGRRVALTGPRATGLPPTTTSEADVEAEAQRLWCSAEGGGIMVRPALEDSCRPASRHNCSAPCQALAFPTKLKAATEWLSSTRMRKANKSVRTLVLGWVLLVGGPLMH